MSLNLNDAAMAGNVEEVLIRLNLGEDVNQKCYPRYNITDLIFASLPIVIIAVSFVHYVEKTLCSFS